MSVTLATTPHSNWQQLAPLWNALGCAPGDDANPEGWYVGKHQLPEGHLLLAYTSPEQAVMNAMEAGTPPTQALHKWQADAQVLLNIAKRERKRSILINLELVKANPELVTSAIARHLGHSVEGQQSLTVEPAKDSDPQYQLISAVAVEKSSSAKAMKSKLDSSAFKISGLKKNSSAQKDIDSLFLNLASVTEPKETQVPAVEIDKLEQQHADAVKKLEQENQLLMGQLHVVQEELERQISVSTTNQTEAEKRAAILQKEHAEVRGALESVQAQFLELQKDKASLEKQLTKSDAEKATQANQIKALKAATQTNAKELSAALQEAENLKQQLEDTKASLEEENQLLLDQLHVVQEEFEQQMQASRASNDKLNETYSQLKKEHGLLERRLLKLRESLETLERTNKVLNGNLAEVKNALAVTKKQLAEHKRASEESEKQGTLALASANRRISELSNELNAVVRSTTWKLASSLNGHEKKVTAKRKQNIEKQALEIANSGLFDQAWYLEEYPEVLQSELGPIEHYLHVGAYEGCNPSHGFNTLWYLANYLDVVESGLNPLVHYIRYGKTEERAPTPGSIASLPAPPPFRT
ncbi:hypothetical protein [Marinobacter vinifirmus]|uniref:Uncharacterized protein n=1 Tax=Marinobacter vinifirmus TaxID=355591 RepID=A0A558B2Y1_9GAMM|nr:hypothetical protein [Marinobacter vinifirmus]TVT30874.1 MAG: hypothetical protein FHK81_16150 [Marinobacter vinifirmus]